MQMQLTRWMMSLILVIAMALAAAAQAPAPQGAQRAGGAAAAPASPPMVLSSPAFPEGGIIPHRYTQVEQQVSPALNWTNAPANTQSFVLHMHDLEVSRNRTVDDQVHGLVWNSPGTAKGLPEGVPQGAELPDGTRQISASGQVYRGPGAPANGPLHHYVFEVYALDTRLDVPNGADAWDVRRAVMNGMNGHIIGKAVYVGLFRRPQ
jgi:Raf kinase inhibitor-like YbhB/YbcL family protein